MGFTVKIKFDMSKLQKIKRDSNKIFKTEIEWGWINGKAYNKSDINKRGGIPFALIAIRNEFGGYTKDNRTGKFIYIPSRPYFQQSIKDSVKDIAGSVGTVFTALLTGNEYKSHLQAISNSQVGILKASIAKNNMRPLHPKTVGIKDSTKQWDDTGQLIKNISSKVIYKRSDYKGD